MNLQNIVNQIEKTDPEIYDRLDSRRDVMQRFTNLGGKLALGALPIALGSMLNKAYGQAPTAIIDILNFALTLEYLESEYYNTAIGTSGLIAADQVNSFTTIQTDENAHVAFLKTTITSLGGTPADKPTFDFTANGIYTPFSDYATFLALSQAFEDTGVRAYKGQAAGLQSNKTVLTAALQIHSVEARHASHVRYVRRITAADTDEKPWIVLKSTNNISGVDANYAGEENLTQGGVDITTLNGISGKIGANIATEAFDEPLTMQEVLDIVDPFIV